MPPVTRPGQPVRIEGLRELERAFKLYGRGLEKGLTEVLSTAAEPVKSTAASLALTNIPRITTPWAAMRVGVTKRTAYIAPQRRGTGKARRRQADAFKERLLSRAMEPALEQNTAAVEREVGDALNDLARMWSRV